MQGRSRILFPVLLISATALLAMAYIVIYLETPLARPSARGQAALAAFSVALGGASAALSWLHYRNSRDSRLLFVSVGISLLTAQLAVFHLGWPSIHQLAVAGGTRQPMLGTFPSHAWLWGWFVAASCFSLAPRWRERRGRPPIRAVAVMSTAGGLMLLGDLVLFASRESLPRVPVVTIIHSAAEQALRDYVSPPGTLGAFGFLIWLGCLAALIVAASRLFWGGGRSAIDRGLWATEFLAIVAVVPVMLVPSIGLPAIQPADVAQVLAIFALFLGLIVDLRIESSRMRRESDRAAEITGGRAEIASMVAHEIRGPVSTIRGLAQTSERHYDRLPEEDRREFLRMIEGESDRLLHIADQTSTALKVDAGTLTYTLEPNDLADVVGVAVDKAATAEHPLATELDPGIRVAIDSVRFGEAVRQLVENAATFSPPDAPITVRAYRDGNAAIVEVIDRGPGIPPERRERVFKKFPGFRPPGYEEAGGTGLGLFICRAHILEQGGRIEAKDGPDGGTMLRITLPEREEG